MSIRTCEIAVVNATSVCLYRHLHLLHHGIWHYHPPELIKPGKHFGCLAECTRTFGTFDGKLQYSVTLSGVEYILSAAFEMPLLGANRHHALLGTNMDVRRKDLPGPYHLFILRFKGTQDDASKFSIQLSETKEGALYIDLLRKELVVAADRCRMYEKMSLYDELRLLRSLPRHFIWNVKNVDWTKRLRKTHRSLRIRIVNLTSKTMHLCLNQRHPVPTLDEGLWVEFPSGEIPPSCCTEFGCQSDGLFVGTGGVCTYAITGDTDVFHFRWDQPGMGSSRYTARHTGGRYRVFAHTENLNEGTMLFHVLDPKLPPTLEVLRARAIPQQLVTALESGSVSKSGSPLKADWMSRLEREGFDVTSALLLYVQAGRKGEATIETQELNIVSPRSFFCTIQSSRHIPGGRSIGSNSHLYLEWQIGCERFRHLWKPDERVWLHAGIVGGMGNNEVVMSAVLLPIRNVPTRDLTNGPMVKRSAQEGGEEEEEEEGMEGGRERQVKVNEEEVLEGVVQGFRCVCGGLQPVVKKTLEAKFGRDWRRKCDVPKEHMWVDGTEVPIDMEGLLHIITVFWNDVFEPIIGSPQLLHSLQTVAIYWANQELSNFDAPFVIGFFDAAAELLKVGSEDASINLKKIESGLFSPVPIAPSPDRPGPLSAAAVAFSSTTSTDDVSSFPSSPAGPISSSRSKPSPSSSSSRYQIPPSEQRRRAAGEVTAQQVEVLAEGPKGEVEEMRRKEEIHGEEGAREEESFAAYARRMLAQKAAQAPPDIVGGEGTDRRKEERRIEGRREEEGEREETSGGRERRAVRTERRESSGEEEYEYV